MTSFRPDASSPTGPVARTLYDIAQGFGWPLDPEARLRRALRLLRRIVPYDRCGLLDKPAVGAPRLVVEPDAREEREGVGRILSRFLTLLTDESHRATVRRPPDAALVPLWASPSHLAEVQKGPAPSPLAAAGGLGRFRRGELIHRLPRRAT